MGPHRSGHKGSQKVVAAGGHLTCPVRRINVEDQAAVLSRSLDAPLDRSRRNHIEDDATAASKLLRRRPHCPLDHTVCRSGPAAATAGGAATFFATGGHLTRTATRPPRL